jgi:hypothetical protein
MENASDMAGATRSVNAPASDPISLRNIGSACGGRASFVSVCHELSHQLGTVDLYGATGLNQDCTLMCATIYPNFDDRRSFYPDAWHRMVLGWIEPQIVPMSAPASFDLSAAATSAPGQVAVLLYEPSHGTSEYFLLEYRTPNPVGGNHYDADVASEGLAIWHVILDENKMPTEIQSLTKPTGTDKSVFLEGPAPAGSRGFSRGANQLWPAGTTPELLWLDGTPTKMRLAVQPFLAGAPSISVALVPVDPRMGSIAGGDQSHRHGG